jgi:hypothetical protein
MEVETGQFRALAEQIAALQAEVAELREDAFTLRTREEVMLRRAGMLPDAPPRRERHLRPVDGGAS